MEYPDNITAAAEHILSRLPRCPRSILVLEDGMEPLSGMIGQPRAMPFSQIPGTESIPGQLVFGLLNGRLTAALCGQGNDPTAAIQVLGAMGVRTLVFCGSGRAVNPRYREGDLMLLCSHIDASGSRDQRLYQPELMQDIKELAAFAGTPLWEGVYAHSPEQADAFGPGLLSGAVTGLDCGMEVIALCGIVPECVTNEIPEKLHGKLRRLIREMAMYL